MIVANFAHWKLKYATHYEKWSANIFQLRLKVIFGTERYRICLIWRYIIGYANRHRQNVSDKQIIKLFNSAVRNEPQVHKYVTENELEPTYLKH